MWNLYALLTISSCIISVTMAVAQETPRPSVFALSRTLDTDGKAADARSTYSTVLRPIAGCQVEIVTVMEAKYSRDTSSTSVDLRLLSPDVRTVIWSDFPPLRNLEMWASNGDPVIRSRSFYSPKNESSLVPRWVEHSGSRLSIVSDDSTAAARLASAFGAAIADCGGRPFTERGRSVRDSIIAIDSAQADSTRGTDAASMRARGLCQSAVREKLKAPSTALFSDEFITGSIAAESRLVSGKVEATNSLGGRVEKKYMCTMKKFGNSWIMNGEPSVF